MLENGERGGSSDGVLRRWLLIAASFVYRPLGSGVRNKIIGTDGYKRSRCKIEIISE